MVSPEVSGAYATESQIRSVSMVSHGLPNRNVQSPVQTPDLKSVVWPPPSCLGSGRQGCHVFRVFLTMLFYVGLSASLPIVQPGLQLIQLILSTED